MNLDLQTLASMTRPPRYIDHVRGADWATLWYDSGVELVHEPDVSPLPMLMPKTGQAPRDTLINAVINADLDTLRAELAMDASGINDPLPIDRGAQGRTLLHFAAKFHGEAAKGHCRNDKLRQMALEHITHALLQAGADPLAEDDYGLWPMTYSHGRSPSCLRDRINRAAQEGAFHAACGEGHARHNRQEDGTFKTERSKRVRRPAKAKMAKEHVA